MRRQTSGPSLSAVFVDYDNIYLSLKRKNEEAARRFARDAGHWIKGIETGELITPTNSHGTETPRRIVMNRCYGNPVPRRNQTDNSTDMSSFPFVRHHFLRAGFEIIDCPPLTAQLKNSSDIRMVMDVIDYLSHGTYFDEFVILSGDADFTPVLHRLRAHARRTVIFANDYTAAPYTAISDGEVREASLIAFLMQGQGEAAIAAPTAIALPPAALSESDREALRESIIAEVAGIVRASGMPVPLEALADRAVRALGHERTVATAWAGTGGFRELLMQALPDDLRVSDQPPYVVIDGRRHGVAPQLQPIAMREASPVGDHGHVAVAAPRVMRSEPLAQTRNEWESRPLTDGEPQPVEAPPLVSSQAPARPQPATAVAPPAPVASQAPSAPARTAPPASAIQQSITRIHEACQAPPLAPPEYRTLFEVMAQEIKENNLLGAQTIQNIIRRAQERGLDVRRDDVRFVMDVVSETDPWYEQGATANLFAGRFRNFVVARCRGQGLKLSADELDLIEAWFAGNGSMAGSNTAPRATATAAPAPESAPVLGGKGHGAAGGAISRQPGGTASAEPVAEPSGRPDAYASDELPRIMRTRFRG